MAGEAGLASGRRSACFLSRAVPVALVIVLHELGDVLEEDR